MKSVRRIRSIVRKGRRDFAPIWKKMARWDDFYFNKSWDEEDQAVVEDRGQKATVNNACAVLTDFITGLLTSAQMDYGVEPLEVDDSGASQAARHLTAGLKHVTVVSKLPRHWRQGVEFAVRRGVGFVLTAPYCDVDRPTAEPTQFMALDSKKVWYDLKAPDMMLQKARYIGYSDWIPTDQLVSAFPDKAAQIRSLEGDDGDQADANLDDVYRLPLDDGQTSISPPIDRWDRADWNIADKHREVDRTRHMVLVHEVYYEDYAKRQYRQTPAGMLPFDPKKDWALLTAPDTLRVITKSVRVIRRCKMAGPYRLEDVLLPTEDHCITAIFWKRKPDGSPFGFIEQVEHQQQEINSRYARGIMDLYSNQWMLDEEQYFGSDGNAKTEEDFRQLQRDVNKPAVILRASNLQLYKVPKDANAGQDLAWVGKADANMHAAAGITESMVGDPSGKSPKSAASQQHQTLQAGLTFETRKAGFLDAYQNIGVLAMQWLIKLHAGLKVVLVDDEATGKRIPVRIRISTIANQVTVTMGPATPTQAEKAVETIRLLLPMLPQVPSIQNAGVMAVLHQLNLPGVQPLRKAMIEYLKAVATGQITPAPVQPPAARPRQHAAHKAG